MKIILASASPRRLELLRGLGLHPVVQPAPLDEARQPGESPERLVQRLAREKGRWVARQTGGTPAAVVLAADTIVVAGDRALGKPRDDDEARSMLRRLAGREHRVVTGVYLWRSDTGKETGGVAVTSVTFRELSETEIDAYVASGESADKAGAYAIQGRGRELVQEIDGSWSNVVGLPLEPLGDWLSALDLSMDRLAR